MIGASYLKDSNGRPATMEKRSEPEELRDFSS